MQSLSLKMSECSLSGRGQSHVSNFNIVDLENFATASRRYAGDIHDSAVFGMFVTRTGQCCVVFECTCLLHIALLYRFNFITSICSGLVIQVVYALFRCNWQEFNCHDASRGHLAIAELLVNVSFR